MTMWMSQEEAIRDIRHRKPSRYHRRRMGRLRVIPDEMTAGTPNRAEVRFINLQSRSGGGEAGGRGMPDIHGVLRIGY